jgi:1,4-alpha-glucan branching enzyme
MHDTLSYIQKDPVYRKYHHGELTFSFVYAWSENFILPISHDEVVHGKGSMINKMPGDYWQKFANLRAYYAYMWTHPGKQLLFMGQEFAQFNEWNAEKSLEWDLLGYDSHKGIQKCIADLNKVYRENPALWQKDCSTDGFYGINCGDSDNSVISFIRYGENPGDFVVVAVNFTPVEKESYRLGVDENCYYEEIFNSDSQMYGGSNFGNAGGVWSFTEGSHGKPFSIDIKLPPLGAVIFKPKR